MGPRIGGTQYYYGYVLLWFIFDMRCAQWINCFVRSLQTILLLLLFYFISWFCLRRFIHSFFWSAIRCLCVRPYVFNKNSCSQMCNQNSERKKKKTYMIHKLITTHLRVVTHAIYLFIYHYKFLKYTAMCVYERERETMMCRRDSPSIIFICARAMILFSVSCTLLSSRTRLVVCVFLFNCS